MTRIAVIITVHNRKDKTLKCLDAIYNQQISDGVSVDVFLTDDGCTDGTPEAVNQAFPSVNIIKGDGNLFWNRGMYAAWSIAEKGNYDFYLWLNDDTYIVTDCIKALLTESSQHSDRTIIVGSTTDTAQTHITYSGWRNSQKIVDLTSDRRVDYFNGNIVLIPRFVFDIVGKNDPYFHHALGDFDYGLRATKAGIESYVCAKPLGLCDANVNVPKWKNRDIPLRDRIKALYSTGRNGANPIEYFYFQRRHRGLLHACITFISNHIHALLPGLWKS